MRRVVITGMGIWSSIGQDLQTVTDSLKKGRSGIIFDPSRIAYGLQSGLVGNVPRPDLKSVLRHSDRSMLSEDAEYAYMAANQALQHAGLNEEYRQKNEVGIIWANDTNSHLHEFTRIMEEEHCPALIGYNALPKSAVSSAVINLSRLFHLTGISMNINAACPGGIHAAGVASMYIQNGMQDTILVGGSFETNKESLYHLVNDAQHISEHHYEHSPASAMRPFDKDAIGAIPSGGAAVIVLEEYEHAIARGANIISEIVGYGFAYEYMEAYYKTMWKAQYVAMVKAIKSANLDIQKLSLIISYADSWPLADKAEAVSLQNFCGRYSIPITATESMTGHEGTMSGVARMVYAALMMQHGFIAPTINLTSPIDEAKDLHIITTTKQTPIDNVLINAGGLGGIYNAIILKNHVTQLS